MINGIIQFDLFDRKKRRLFLRELLKMIVQFVFPLNNYFPTAKTFKLKKFEGWKEKTTNKLQNRRQRRMNNFCFLCLL